MHAGVANGLASLVIDRRVVVVSADRPKNAKRPGLMSKRSSTHPGLLARPNEHDCFWRNDFVPARRQIRRTHPDERALMINRVLSCLGLTVSSGDRVPEEEFVVADRLPLAGTPRNQHAEVVAINLAWVNQTRKDFR